MPRGIYAVGVPTASTKRSVGVTVKLSLTQNVNAGVSAICRDERGSDRGHFFLPQAHRGCRTRMPVSRRLAVRGSFLVSGFVDWSVTVIVAWLENTTLGAALR